MKKTVISIFLAFIFIYSLPAQVKKSDNLSAGQCLQRSANFMYSGMALTVASTIPLFLPDFKENNLKNPTNLYTTSEAEAKATGKQLCTPSVFNQRMKEYQKADKETRSLNYVTSGVFGVAAVICYIQGIQHIKLAGKKLEMQSSGNAVGLALRF